MQLDLMQFLPFTVVPLPHHRALVLLSVKCSCLLFYHNFDFVQQEFMWPQFLFSYESLSLFFFFNVHILCLFNSPFMSVVLVNFDRILNVYILCCFHGFFLPELL